MVSRVCLGLPDKPCGEIIPANSTRCTECQRAVWRARPKRHAAPYDAKWRRLSKRQRRREPLCQLRLPGCTVLATEADHIVPVTRGGTSTPDNLQSACGSCNKRKRALDKELYE